MKKIYLIVIGACSLLEFPLLGREVQSLVDNYPNNLFWQEEEEMIF